MTTTVSIYNGTTLITESQRHFTNYRNANEESIGTLAYVPSVTATQPIEARVRVSAGSVALYERTLLLMKVAAS
jgi:Fe-S cluster assembly scaffold protein SufB